MTYSSSWAVMKIRLIARSGMNRAMLCFSSVCFSLIPRLIRQNLVDEDTRRREYLLNVILLISLSALILLGMTIIWNKATAGSTYDGMSPLLFFSITAIYAWIFYLSKKGLIYSASVILVTLDALGTIYTGWKWGASLPETLLLTVLVIETASVLIGSTIGFITAGGMICALTLLGIHESIYLNVPDWRYDEISVTDVITYSVMFLFISFIAWLANREIGKSLVRARTSEKLLSIERDTLEQKVSERTEELVVSQQKIFSEAQHTINIGELARGVIHDMMNPLSAISLCVEELNLDGHDIKTKQLLIEKATEASCRMKEFMGSAKHHIDPRLISTETCANLKKELDIVHDILAYKARMNNVQIEILPCEDIQIEGCPLRVHQMILNLLSNAIESFEKNLDDASSDKQKTITVLLTKNINSVILSVADNGCGMSENQIQGLFNQPHTTKLHGTGIGLMTVNSIITKELSGSIEVKSTEGVGTTFIITIPNKLHGEGLGSHKK